MSPYNLLTIPRLVQNSSVESNDLCLHDDSDTEYQVDQKEQVKELLVIWLMLTI